MSPKPLTPAQFPYTGPYGLPHTAMKSKGPTAVALKRAMWRMGTLRTSTPEFDAQYNLTLARALERWDPGKTGYGPGRWEKIRRAVVPKGKPHAGELALDDLAVALVLEEHNGAAIDLVYPHPAGSRSTVCQGLHPTEGLPGNWAVDLCAPGGTTIIAPFAGIITRLSGNDPATGVHHGDIFGWSTYLARADGVLAYITHQGRRTVHAGQLISLAEQIGAVGTWPHDPGRSHTHIGITSPHGTWDAKKIVTAISVAPRVDL